jgi:hypothetical protein
MAEVMPCYIYCFCAVPSPEMLPVVGIAGLQIQVIECDGISVVAADCSECPGPSAQNVVAHNRVVNAILRFTTPVPCRFGTVLSHRDLEHYIETNGPALKSLLERFQGCVEMSLRVTRNSEGVDVPFGADAQARSATMLPQSAGPGTRFLAEKIRESAQREIANQQAQAILNWADGLFGGAVRDRVARLRPDGVLMADVAHLVERGRLDHYRAVFASAASQRSDLGLSMSGPWAPYSFAAGDESNH